MLYWTGWFLLDEWNFKISLILLRERLSCCKGIYLSCSKVSTSSFWCYFLYVIKFSKGDRKAKKNHKSFLFWIGINITKMKQGELIPKIGRGRRETEGAVFLSRTPTDRKDSLSSSAFRYDKTFSLRKASITSTIISFIKTTFFKMKGCICTNLTFFYFT